MGLGLVILFFTIGLGLCLSQDNDKLIVDYVAELHERNVVLPSGRELCFYHRVPSYWAGRWELEFYHMSEYIPNIDLKVRGPYKDDGDWWWQNIVDHPNTPDIQNKVFQLGSNLVVPMDFQPGMYSLCLRNENVKSEPAVVWFGLNHEPNAESLPTFNAGNDSKDRAQHDLQVIRALINRIESAFYRLEKNQVLSGKQSENRYFVLTHVHVRLAFLYIFEICLFLGVAVLQILVVKTWFLRRR